MRLADRVVEFLLSLRPDEGIDELRNALERAAQARRRTISIDGNWMARADEERRHVAALEAVEVEAAKLVARYDALKSR